MTSDYIGFFPQATPLKLSLNSLSKKISFWRSYC